MMGTIAFCEYNWPLGCGEVATHIVFRGFADIYYCEAHFIERKDEFLAGAGIPEMRYR